MTGVASGRRLLTVSLIALLAATACSGSSADQASPERTKTSTEVYVAVGADETVGAGAERPLVEAWPQLMFRSLDRGATFVSAGAEGATVAEAIQEQLPIVRGLEPTLVTVWLNANDLVAGVTPGVYEQELGDLVHAVRQDGRARVLVANTLPLEELPAYADGGDAAFAPHDEVVALVDAYNDAIAAVAAREGAEVVDLHAFAEEATTEGTFASLLAEDGAHPNTDGHAAIAEVFEAALSS